MIDAVGRESFKTNWLIMFSARTSRLPRSRHGEKGPEDRRALVWFLLR